MKFNAEMKVVRFGNEDVIATSVRFTAGNFGNSIAGDGYAIFNGTTYTFSSKAAVADFVNALGVTNPGISANGTTQSLTKTFGVEAESGAGKKWNGSYLYDPDATWGDGNLGVFKKQ